MGNHGNHFSEPPDMRVAGGISVNCVWIPTYLRSDTYLRVCADLKTMVGLSCSHDHATPTERQEDPYDPGGKRNYDLDTSTAFHLRVLVHDLLKNP